MPRRNRNVDKMRMRKRSRNNLRDGNISETALRYNGPIVPSAFKQMSDKRTEVMKLDTELVASGSGTITTVLGSNPTAYSNWSGYSTTYDEYRVLAMQVHFEPYQRYHDAALNTSPIYVVTDRGDATALTSYQNALEYASVQMFNTADRWGKSIKMLGTEDAAWIPIATGVSSLYVKLYAGILTNSTAIGRLSTTLLVQFRGTK